jgi:dipeptidyl aminopeptidase/acylaminoacyl peptidase
MHPRALLTDSECDWEVSLIGKLAVLNLLCAATLFGTGCHGQGSATMDTRSTPHFSENSSSAQIFSVVEGRSSFIYIQPQGASQAHRLTTRKSGWETDGAVSPNGDAVAFALADGPESKSEVWLSKIDGSNAHRVSAAEEDALMPAFAPDGKTLLYAKSGFNGHYSPIARPRKHQFDVMKVLIDSDGPAGGAVPVELTQQGFFDFKSLSVSPDGERFLVSTSEYPIGSLIVEFDIAKPLGIKKIFQPHVPSEPPSGAEFGQAVYTNDGMGIVFTAATAGKDGMFDYNVYQMSDVTGAELVQLTHRTGTIDQMNVGRDGTVYFSENGQRYSFAAHTRQAQSN